MAADSCITLLKNISEIIDESNIKIIDHMTDSNFQQSLMCVKPNTSYGYFFDEMALKWNKIINKFLLEKKCDPFLINLLVKSKKFPVQKVQAFTNVLQSYDIPNFGALQNIPRSKLEALINDPSIKELALDEFIDFILEEKIEDYALHPNLKETSTRLFKLLINNCFCESVNVFREIIKVYKKKYMQVYSTQDKNKIKKIIKQDYTNLMQYIQKLDNVSITNIESSLADDMTNSLTTLYGFSVESELNRLIPDELGSLKNFFVTVIKTYFNELHPIIWAQILKKIIDDFPKELPYGKEEIFAFLSKCLLLNSGPFILKILQMIRPVLTPELKNRYNLNRLSYPLMTHGQVDVVLNKVVNEWHLYKVVKHISASVGHVCIVYRVDKPNYPFIIKIIKPLSIAQSCWEYKTLHNIPSFTDCEKQFVKNMLESNGEELDARNEIKNIMSGKQYYSATYSEVFGYDINAKLSSIQNIPNVIKDDCWFALTMSLAPGVPLSELVENDMLKEDTKYRAKLHRCLDLLVYKYFMNIVQNGFYHGDLHAGNVFFSYEKSVLTLIDFGAVGHINLYSKDPATEALLEIIVMSMFHNFEGILDVMSRLLNNRCTETKVDTTSTEYQNFREELIKYHHENIRNELHEKQREEQYKKDIFSQTRINDEKEDIKIKNTSEHKYTNAYSYLEYEGGPKEVVVENKNILPVFTEIVGDKKQMTFANVLEKIIAFYAKNGVNIAIKFNDFFSFQKAYLLLLGTMKQVGYSSYRVGIAIRKAILSWKNTAKLLEIPTVLHVYNIYTRENKKNKELTQNIHTTQQMHPTQQMYPTQQMHPTQQMQSTQKFGVNWIEQIPNSNMDNMCPLFGGTLETDYYRKYMKYKKKYINNK